MLTYENSVQFVKGESAPVSLRNFFPPEDGFIWSSSHWSEITFGFSATPAGGKEHADLILDFDVFKIVGHVDGQNALIYLNGLRVGSHYITQRTTLVIPIDAAMLKPSGNVLTFDTPDTRKPSEFGIPDERQLGIQLFSMQIRAAG
jgi:hypothetical protein